MDSDQIASYRIRSSQGESGPEDPWFGVSFRCACELTNPGRFPSSPSPNVFEIVEWHLLLCKHHWFPAMAWSYQNSPEIAHPVSTHEKALLNVKQNKNKAFLVGFTQRIDAAMFAIFVRFEISLWYCYFTQPLQKSKDSIYVIHTIALRNYNPYSFV